MSEVRALIQQLVDAGLEPIEAAEIVTRAAIAGAKESVRSAGAIRQERLAETSPQIAIRGKWDESEWQRRRRIVFERDNYTCVYCGTDVHINPQCDHVVPLIQGGGHEIENLATACKQCNSGKSGKLLEEWEGPKWGSYQRQ